MPGSDQKQRLSFQRLLPLLLLLALIGFAFAMDWHLYLRPRVFGEFHEQMQMFVIDNLAIAIVCFAGIYVASVALSIPGAGILTILGGFLFGPFMAAAIVVPSATLGATVLFLVAKSSIGDFLAEKVRPYLEKLDQDFENDSFNVLLFLRLVPAFPFWLVNLAPAFLGVKTRTFFVATFFGIIPGTIAYSYVGGGFTSIVRSAWHDPTFQVCLGEEQSGLRAVGDCRMELDLSHFITPQVIAAFILLGVVALIPVILRHRRNAKAS